MLRCFVWHLSHRLFSWVNHWFIFKRDDWVNLYRRLNWRFWCNWSLFDSINDNWDLSGRNHWLFSFDWEVCVYLYWCVCEDWCILDGRYDLFCTVNDSDASDVGDFNVTNDFGLS